MSSRVPVVAQSILTVETAGLGEEILVGEPAWFAWLLTADTFRYDGPEGHFTARKEPASHGRGGSYWKAYRRSGGKLRRAYLGASVGLSADRLGRAARQVAGSDELPTAPTIAAVQDLPSGGVGRTEAAGEPLTPRVAHLRLLGGFELTDGDGTVVSIGSPRAQALLSYLVLHRGVPRSRREISFLLWPDSSEAQARNSLRQLLHQLRQSWPDADAFLSTSATTLTIRLAARSSRWTSRRTSRPPKGALAADRRLGSRRASASRSNRPRPCTTGTSSPVRTTSGSFPERERLTTGHERLLDRLISLLEQQGDYRSAIDHGQRRLRLDPLDERVCRLLMRLHVLNQDRAGALRVYQSMVSLLDRELGVEPDAETLDGVPTDRRPRRRCLGRPGTECDGAHRASRCHPPRRPAGGMGSHHDGLAPHDRRRCAVRPDQRPGRDRQVEARGRAVRLGRAAGDQAGPDAGLRGGGPPVVRAGRGLASEPGPRCRTATPRPRLAQRDLPSAARAPDQPTRPAPAIAARRGLAASGVLPIPGAGVPDRGPAAPARVGRPPVVRRRHPRMAAFPAPIRPTGEPARGGNGPVRRGGQTAPVDGGPGRVARHSTTDRDRPWPARRSRDVGAGRARRRSPSPPGAGSRHPLETEGNPLFVVETVRAGLEDAEVPAATEPPDGLVEPGSTRAARRLPPRVQAVIAARLGQLSEPAHALAAAAATVGRAFTLDLARVSSGVDDDILVNGLDELLDRQVVREQGNGVYDFAHDKIREVAYGELTEARRRLLHKRVAEGLERLHAADSTPWRPRSRRITRARTWPIAPPASTSARPRSPSELAPTRRRSTSSSGA